MPSSTGSLTPTEALIAASLLHPHIVCTYRYAVGSLQPAGQGPPLQMGALPAELRQAEAADEEGAAVQQAAAARPAEPGAAGVAAGHAEGTAAAAQQEAAAMQPEHVGTLTW